MQTNFPAIFSQFFTLDLMKNIPEKSISFSNRMHKNIYCKVKVNIFKLWNEFWIL